MSDVTDHDDRPSPWTRPGFVAAVVVLTIVVALGITIAILGPADEQKAAPAPAVPPPTSAAASSSASPATGCVLPVGEQTVPQATPADTTWELVGTMAAPSAPARYGPTQTRDGVRTCFAHNPIGALYAAVNVVAMTTRPELRLALVRTLGASGAARDLALRQLASATPTDSSGTHIQLAGFSMLNFTSQNTTVDLAFRVATPSNNGYGHLPVQLTWQDGDWRVVLSANGDLGENSGGLPDLTGYIPWSGA